MNVIKKIICLFAISGSLVPLNNLAMSLERAVKDFRNRILTSMQDALDQRDLRYIHSILASYPGLANTRLYDGTTLLIKTIETNHDEAAILFLRDPNTDVNIPDAEGNSPLHYLFSPGGTQRGTPVSEFLVAYRSGTGKIIPLALARGASPFARNNNGESVLSIIRWDYPWIYKYWANYANYAKILYNSARRGDLRGVQYALVKGNVSVNLKNNDLEDDLPVHEIGNTPFHAAILGALDRYDQLLPEINRINELRNVGANKLVPASYFNKQMRKLRAPIDNMLCLIKIHNPDTTIRNDQGETVGDLMSKAITEHVKTWRLLFEILSEPREQSMEALRRAKIIE